MSLDQGWIRAVQWLRLIMNHVCCMTAVYWLPPSRLYCDGSEGASLLHNKPPLPFTEMIMEVVRKTFVVETTLSLWLPECYVTIVALPH